MASKNEPLYLVDASVYLFRAFFSLPDSIRDAEGRSANVIYGFTDFLIKFRETSQARLAALCFDESLTTSFRNEIDPAYKANRPEAPEDLKRQIRACKEVGAMMGFSVYASPRYEADDLMGSLAHRYRSKNRGARVCIVSTDKDLLQVLEPLDEFWNFSKDERFKGKDVKQRVGVHAHQMADLLAMTGDPVDNITGLPGIGKTTAAAILSEFKTLDSLLKRIDSLKDHSMRGAARFHRIICENLDVLEKSRKLTLIETGLEVEPDLKRLSLGSPDIAGLDGFFSELGVGQRLLGRIKIVGAHNGAGSGKRGSASGTSKAQKKRTAGQGKRPGAKKSAVGKSANIQVVKKSGKKATTENSAKNSVAKKSIVKKSRKKTATARSAKNSAAKKSPKKVSRKKVGKSNPARTSRAKSARG